MFQGGPIFQLINAMRDGDIAGVIGYLSLIVVILLIAFPLHELAHAVTADKLGDDTPRLNGRLTLNPFKHLSLLGSLLFLTLGFGWATTPINPLNFRGNWRMKHALVAVAGPITNLLLAVIFAVIYRVVESSSSGESLVSAIVLIVCQLAVRINLFLAFFNLIPFPPLDGSTILLAFASDGVRALFQQVSQYSFYIIMLLSFSGLFGAIVNVLVNPPVRALFNILIP